MAPWDDLLGALFYPPGVMLRFGILLLQGLLAFGPDSREDQDH